MVPFTRHSLVQVSNLFHSCDIDLKHVAGPDGIIIRESLFFSLTPQRREAIYVVTCLDSKTGVVLPFVRASPELCIEEHPLISRRKIDAVTIAAAL